MAEKAKTESKTPTKSERKRLHIEVIRQMITLSTSGFGVVAALAWNSVIQEFVNTYVKRWLPDGSGLFSLLIYAAAVTGLAVFVTMQLSSLVKRLENE